MDALKNIGFGKIAVVVLILAAIVGGYVYVRGFGPPPRPQPIEAGTDDPELYRTTAPPAPAPVPVVDPARLAVDDLALFVQGRVGEGHIERTIAIVNRGQAPGRIDRMEVIGDPAFAFVGTSGSCSEVPGGEACRARIILSTTLSGSYRSALVVNWRAAGAAGASPEIRVALTGEVATAEMLPDIEIPRDWAAERLRQLKAERAAASGGFFARRPGAGGADGAAGPASQPDYGGGTAKRVGSLPVDRTRVVTTDRYIEATLETSINSRVPGEIRAIVARNVLGADGRLVLIPARSKLVGRYQGLLPAAGTSSGGRALKSGDTRLAVVWTRIIRPDGAHIVIKDGGYDAMGRSGLIGEVDNRLAERFFAASLVSAISFAGSAAQAALEDRQNGYQAITSGSQTVLVPSTPSRLANALSGGSRNAVDRLSSVTEKLLEEGLALEPIITIPQGTNFFVIPQADIWIPAPTRDGSATTALALRDTPGAPARGPDAGEAVLPPVAPVEGEP